MIKLIVFFTLILSLLGGLAVGLTAAPFYVYKKLLKGEFSSEWFRTEKVNLGFMTSTRYPYLISEKSFTESLWKNYQIGDVKINLPYRHPLYTIIPILKVRSKTKLPDIGLKFIDPSAKVISKIFFLPNTYFHPQKRAQKLFELPISKVIIDKNSTSYIWSDMFSLDIKSNKKMDYDQMIYNLYILQLRSKFFPKVALKFGNIGQEDVGIITLNSDDKDFTSELVLTMRNGIIYSYVIFSKIGNSNAESLKERFLRNIIFKRGDIHLGKLAYQEFKSSPYQVKKGQAGFLQLFSSWTNWEEKREDLTKEMIFFLERGRNRQQLEPLYSYAYLVFGKVFSLKGLNFIDDPMLRLQYEIEQEDATKIRESAAQKEVIVEPILTPLENIKLKLRQAKESKKSKRRTKLTID